MFKIVCVLVLVALLTSGALADKKCTGECAKCVVSHAPGGSNSPPVLQSNALGTIKFLTVGSMDYLTGARYLLMEWCFYGPKGMSIKVAQDKAQCSVTFKPAKGPAAAKGMGCYPMDCGPGVKSACFPPKVNEVLGEEYMDVEWGM